MDLTACPRPGIGRPGTFRTDQPHNGGKQKNKDLPTDEPQPVQKGDGGGIFHIQSGQGKITDNDPFPQSQSPGKDNRDQSKTDTEWKCKHHDGGDRLAECKHKKIKTSGPAQPDQHHRTYHRE